MVIHLKLFLRCFESVDFQKERSWLLLQMKAKFDWLGKYFSDQRLARPQSLHTPVQGQEIIKFLLIFSQLLGEAGTAICTNILNLNVPTGVKPCVRRWQWL